MEETTRVTHGSRIKFIRNGNLMMSYKIFSNGHLMARIVINTDTKHYQIIDPVTGFVHVDGPKTLTNLEVVQRNAKKSLIELLDIVFDKEVRKTENDHE